MIEPVPPTLFEGHWIWDPSDTNKCLLSYEFFLNEIPNSADFWFAVGEFAHIYINGMHLTYGPHTGSNDKYSLNYLDATLLLQSGKNHIAVIATSPQLSLYSRTKHDKGFWAQLEVDNKMHVTNNKWKSEPAFYINDGAPRRAAGCLPVQSFDLHKHSDNWLSEDTSDQLKPAKELQAIHRDQLTNKTYALKESTIVSYGNIRSFGQYEQVLSSLHIDFSSIYTKPGTYVATCYFYSEIETSSETLTLSDSAFKVYLNHRSINSQGHTEYINDADPEWTPQMSAMERGELNPMCTAQIKQGWNSIRIISYCDDNSKLFAMNFVELGSNEVIPHTSRDEESEQGILITGPLKLPFNNLLGPLNFNLLAFAQVQHSPFADASVYLQSCSFHSTKLDDESPKAYTLQKHNYLCYDFGSIQSGCVKLDISADQDSDIFLVFSESFNDGVPRSLHPLHGRRSLNVKLKKGHNEWEDFYPVGMRYIFILSENGSAVHINDVQLITLKRTEQNYALFECPDNTINQIWNKSLSTLNSCSEYGYMDSPSGRRAQLLQDAAFQSMTSMICTGDYKKAKDAIFEFARGQYETGELPSVYPSSYYYTVGEWSMYWVMWLQRYLLNTGDTATAQELLGTMNEILKFYSFYENEDTLLTGSIAVLSSQIPDDAPMESDVIFTSINCLYLKMLSSASWIYSFLELDQAELTKQKMHTIGKNLRAKCWNQEKSIYVDWEQGGVQSEQYSAEANFLALSIGIIPSAGIAKFTDLAISQEAPFIKLSFLHQKSPFLYDLIANAATNVNLRTWAFDLIKFYWGKMVDNDLSTWPEFFDPDEEFSKESTSLCHGIGSGPNLFFVNEVAGIRPAAPGYQQIYFSPLTTRMDWARCHFHTPHGFIKVEWVKNPDGGIDVQIESSYELDIIPQLKQEIANISSFHLSENISVIGHQDS